ncbi:MAG: sigma-54-dependent transcriptional regulator [Bdellovibrionales bacterium]
MTDQNFLNILIVDDEAELRQSVSAVIRENLLQPVTIKEAEDGESALRLVDQEDFDFIFMDVRMPGMSGLEALTKIKSLDPRIMVIILTAHSNLQDAVSAIKDGAYDYLTKPVESNSILKILNEGITAKRMISDLAVSAPIFDDDIESEVVGSSKKMREVFDLVYRLSKVDTTVLVRGEHGTGKELVAKAIHHSSSRKSGKFIKFDCSAYNDLQLELELFGHEKGAFEGATQRKIGVLQEANNGTLFLDDIGKLKPDLQVRLLRVLQDKTFTPLGATREIKTNARIIASTNQNLEKMIEDGSYREDLFYRLNVMPIFLPPLRERLEDLEVLSLFFIKKFNKIHSRNITTLSKSALELLKMHSWNGNIRELESVIEHAFIVEKSDQITTGSLPEAINKIPQKPDHLRNTRTGKIDGPLDFESFKEESEKQFIIQALKGNSGRINKTVASANIPKNTLLRKIKKYGINVKDYQ